MQLLDRLAVLFQRFCRAVYLRRFYFKFSCSEVEVNPLAVFVGNDEAAMRDPPRANRMALDASTHLAPKSKPHATPQARVAIERARPDMPMTSTDRWALNEYTPGQLSIMARATDSAAKCDTKCMWQMEEPSRRQNDLKSLPAQALLRVSTRFYYLVG